jgi:Cu/Ag efflux protein CusF
MVETYFHIYQFTYKTLNHKEVSHKMRRLIVATFMGLGLILGGVSSFAAETKQQTIPVVITPTEIKGEIVGVVLRVKDKVGITHLIRVTDPKELKGLKTGDNIDVKLEKGKAVSIEKVEGTMSAATPAPTAKPKAK